MTEPLAFPVVVVRHESGALECWNCSYGSKIFRVKTLQRLAFLTDRARFWRNRLLKHPDKHPGARLTISKRLRPVGMLERRPALMMCSEDLLKHMDRHDRDGDLVDKRLWERAITDPAKAFPRKWRQRSRRPTPRVRF